MQGLGVLWSWEGEGRFGLDDADIQDSEQGKHRLAQVPLCLFCVCARRSRSPS